MSSFIYHNFINEYSETITENRLCIFSSERKSNFVEVQNMCIQRSFKSFCKDLINSLPIYLNIMKTISNDSSNGPKEQKHKDFKT